MERNSQVIQGKKGKCARNHREEIKRPLFLFLRREKKAIFAGGWNGGFMAVEGRERGRGEEDRVMAGSTRSVGAGDRSVSSRN